MLLNTIKKAKTIIVRSKEGKYYQDLRSCLGYDEEHGAGVLMAGFDVLDTGNQDHAYYTYALH